MNKFKVFIIGGGGIFGTIPACFLSYLGDSYKLSEKVDSISGTSIGGILASAYIAGNTPSSILNAFVNNGSEIFSKSLYNQLNPAAIPFYDNAPLSKFVHKFLGDKTVEDIAWRDTQCAYFVPCMNMTKNKIKVFDNIVGDDFNRTLYDISMYTSAAIAYFPILEDNSDAITDAGVLEVVPVITTATAIKDKLGIDFKDMDVFVLCSGNSINKDFGNYETVSSWNILELATNFIIPNITNGNEIMSKFWGENMGFNSFTWYNPIQVYTDLDDTSSIPYMLDECEMRKEEFLDKWSKFTEN